MFKKTFYYNKVYFHKTHAGFYLGGRTPQGAGDARLENLEFTSQGAWGKLSEQQAAVEFLLCRRKFVSFLSPRCRARCLELGQGPGGSKKPGHGMEGAQRRHILHS